MLIVVQGELAHIQQLVRLSKAVPRPVILPIDVLPIYIWLVDMRDRNICSRGESGSGLLKIGVLTDSFSICFDSGMCVLHFYKLMSHEGPSGKIRVIQLCGSLEVLDGAFGLRS